MLENGNFEGDCCLKCGNTGVMANGLPCDCGIHDRLLLPRTLDIPYQYQSIRFDKTFLKPELQLSYGTFMEQLINEVTQNIKMFNKNILICAPPNSGKTVFAYTLYGMLYAKGVSTPKFMDISEARSILMEQYTKEKDTLMHLTTAPIVVLKIPMDVPNKFPEIISSIIDRRVRNGTSTIFLFNGTLNDLIAQDKFNKFKSLVGDGSYNSLMAKSWGGVE